ncbi:MAG: helix-turn-helix domain-containing protein [Chitinophagales bacterium]|nr:helix-turn-helix domain-containing protein [Chitinophagales bacterium]
MEKAAKTTQKPEKATKRRKSAKTAKPAQVRRKYATDIKEEAKDLYLRGVTLDRVAKYLAVPLRTLTNWQTDERWTEAKNPERTAHELKGRGYRVPEIADRLEVSVKTVRKWLKASV